MTALLLNLVFFFITLGTALVRRDLIAQRAREAFAAGALTEEDWPILNRTLGGNQYSDCVVFQMLLDQDPNVLKRGFAPSVHYRDENWQGLCTALRDRLAGHTDSYPTMAYTRFWHGYNALAAALLPILPFARIRQVMKAALYAALIFMPIAARLRARHSLLPLAFAIATAGLFFWGLPYFGPSLAHAPGDIAVITGLTAFLWYSRRLAWSPGLFAFCAAFGCIVAYFEFFTAQLPTAAGLLVPAVYLAISSEGKPGLFQATWRRTIQSLAAFGLGAAVTVITKQALGIIVVGGSAVEAFWGHFVFYSRPPEGSSALHGFASAVTMLVSKSAVLIYGSRSAAAVVLIVMALAWITAMALAFIFRSPARNHRFAAFVVGALAMPLWVLIFTNHTEMHAAFMTRLLVIPVALGFAALIYQLNPAFSKPVHSGIAGESA